MHGRREPTLSIADSDSQEQERCSRGPIIRDAPEANNEEPPFMLWVAAIALGLLLGGLGVKLITDWHESRQAKAAVKQFVAVMSNVNEQTNRQLAASVAVANAQAASARAHAAAVAEKQRAQEMALNAERQRIDRLRIAAAEQAAGEKTRRDAAWAKFYRPSPACQDPESRAAMKCANEFARAQKEFHLRWSQRAI